MQYYYLDSKNTAQGPVDVERLRELLRRGELTNATMIAVVGSQQWAPMATAIPEVGYPSRYESTAIVSFSLSVAGFCCCGIIFSIPAIICGHIAIARLAKDRRLLGKGFAIAGLVIGYVGLVAWGAYIGLYVVALILGWQENGTPPPAFYD